MEYKCSIVILEVIQYQVLVNTIFSFKQFGEF